MAVIQTAEPAAATARLSASSSRVTCQAPAPRA
jgi:hypothetical protein